ncbi:hypothetical protein Tco_0493125 [Tanacetum coccineum]
MITRLAEGSTTYHVGVLKDVMVHIRRLTVLAGFHILDMAKDPKSLLLVERGYITTESAIIDCMKSMISIREGHTRSISGVKEHDCGDDKEEPRWLTGFVKFVLRTSKGSRAKDSVITHVVDVPIVPGNEGDVLTDICMNKMNNGTSAFLTVVPFSSTTGPSIPTSAMTDPTAKLGPTLSLYGSATKNGCEHEIPASYANKLSPTSLTKANLRKLDANVLNDADYDIWLPLASVHEVNNRMKNLLYSYFICKRLAFLIMEWFVRNNWEKCRLKIVTLVKGFLFFKFSSIEGVDSVLRDVWVKFNNVALVSYTSDGLSLIAMKIGTLMMIDSHTNSMCLESWGRSSYARIMIEINACNDFSDKMVMIVPDLEGKGYTKETIRVEYDEKKKFGGNNGCSKNFKLVLVKPKTHYRPKAKQSTEGASHKTNPSISKKNVSTSEEEQSSTPLVEKINIFKKQLVEGKCLLVDDDSKPLEKVNYSGDQGSKDEVESVDNEMTSYLSLKPSRVGYGTKSLLE